ncbi:MAG: aminotransferase class IV [Rubellimicrobium sp.]|nr:aminotransferase class IV [Rubellimicrobium sp.]
MEDPLRTGSRDPGLRLIETLAGDAPDARLALHLARMARGAARLGWRLDPAEARAALAPLRGQALRLRLTLDRAGALRVESAPLPAAPASWRVVVAAQVLDPDDPWLGVKSTRRAAHDAARAALPAGAHEAILANTRGEMCEGTISTLFFDRGDGLRTPPLASGLLPGVLRAEMLAQGAVREESLRAADLPGLRLWMGNSLRGLIPARLV